MEAQQQGLIECDEDRVRLTERGRLFANDVFERFLGVVPEQDPACELLKEEGVWA
jgi:coproporphyrinogen III oxidase-like Fe-S oxidoreductase